MDEGAFSYRPRIVDSALKRKLRGKGAVLIEGPRWCGKTTTTIITDTVSSGVSC